MNIKENDGEIPEFSDGDYADAYLWSGGISDGAIDDAAAEQNRFALKMPSLYY